MNNSVNNQPNQSNNTVQSVPSSNVSLPVVDPTNVVVTNTTEIPVVDPTAVPQNVSSAENPSATVPAPDSAATLPPTSGGDSGVVLNEKLKEVEINYTPPSKGKIISLIVLFILLIAFVLFLPEITTFINIYMSGNSEKTEEIITTGKLKCSLSTSTSNLDKTYDLTFNFTDSKLQRTAFEITTRGDSTEDEAVLDEMANICNQLSKNVDGLNGVNVSCSYSNGQLKERQTFDLSQVNPEELDSAFEEAGGNNPEYRYEQDIDTIEKGMYASGYSCEREK